MKKLILLAAVPLLAAGDWRQFRGTDSASVAADKVPTKFGADGPNVAWKAKLPGRGLSGPVIVGDRVFLTASDGLRHEDLFVLAYDANTGKQLWKRQFRATGPTASHPKTCMAAPTPASDGERLVALFATNDLICVDLDGNPLWIRSLYSENPGATDGRGLASSPVIVGDTVVVQVENQNTSFAAGIDIKTGANRWRMDRPRELNWTSPIALPEGQVLLQGMKDLIAVDAKTGREAWKLERESDPIASSTLSGGVLYVPGGEGLTALELRGTEPPKELWRERRLSPVTASPVVLDGKVFAVRSGILAKGDAGTGKVEGQMRMTGPFSSTPIAAGGVLYCFNEKGECQIVEPADDGDDELLGTCELGETILATPAVANGALYVRSDNHLWKIAGS